MVGGEKSFRETWLWQQAFEVKRTDSRSSERKFFKQHLLAIRERAAVLVSQIPRDMPGMTVHDISHLDALWEMAELITEDAITINPPEAFVLGVSILLHDAGYCLAAYPGGLAELKSTTTWKDVVASEALAAQESRRESIDIENLPPEIEKQVIARVLRLLHAERAAALAQKPWINEEEQEEHLIEHSELRRFYGPIIGKIAHSHWWPVNDLERSLSVPLGGLAKRTRNTVDPLLLACILRIADAMHLDSRRAPTFLRAIARPQGESAVHWAFQERFAVPIVNDRAVVFTSGDAFRREDANAWWLAHDTLVGVDRELREVDLLLKDTRRTRFNANQVQGVRSPEDLAKYLETQGWRPVDARLKVSNVPRIVASLGGAKLYGDDPTVALRELIQNAADAVQARRKLEERPGEWGLITVSLTSNQDGTWLVVEDNGIGMSERVLTGALLDYGTSFWSSSAVTEEFPGLMQAGMQAIGRYGIGFFSVFLLGSRVRVYSRRYDRGQGQGLLLEFAEGTNVRPILSRAPGNSAPIDGGTRVEVLLQKNLRNTGGLLHTGSGAEEITLAGLVGSLAPNPDVAIVSAEREKKVPVAKPGDWLEIADQDLLYRLSPETILGGNKDAGDAPKLLQPIVDDEGCVHGRACVWPTDLPEFWASNDWGVLTIGGLRASALRNVRGVLVGKALTIARNTGRPTVPVGTLAKWASKQAALIAETIKDEQQQAGSAEVVLECGGEVGDLKIVRWGMEWLSASEFKARLRGLEEIAVSLQGDFVYDEGDDDVLPREFEWSFCVSDDVVVVLKYKGAVVRAGRNSWPRCATQFPEPEVSNVADLVKVELTRFRGYLILWEGGPHDVKIKTSIFTGISPANGCPGAFGAHAGVAVARV